RAIDIAKRQHQQSLKSTGKMYNIIMDVYVTVKLETGEITKVTYKNVSAVRAGDTGENVTQGEVEGYLKSLAGAYRSEVRLEKGGKPLFALRLELEASQPALPITPPPRPLRTANASEVPATPPKQRAKVETPVTPPPAKKTDAPGSFPPPPAAAPVPAVKATGSVNPPPPPAATPAPALKKDGVTIPPTQ